MRSAPSPKKKSNLPLLVGGGAVLLLAVVFMPSDDPAGAVTSSTKKKKSSVKTDSIYTEEDAKAKFSAYTKPAVDVFNPLVKKAVRETVVMTNPPAGGSPSGVPGALTGGDANWYFTGYAELNGVREGLLENTVSGETVSLSPGAAWKAGQVVSVDASVMTMTGPGGTEFKIPIQQYGVAPGAAPVVDKAPTTVAAGQPLTVPGGNIGGIGVRPVAGTATMTLPDGRTVQVPLDAGTAAAANPINVQNGNRRGRRNRNAGENNVP